MKRYGWWIGALCACGDVQEKPDLFDNDVWDQSNPSSQTEEPTQEESAELDEDYCDYVYLLERRLSGSEYFPYLWRFDPATANLVELGFLDCPFQSGDYLIAMTADQKGQLWFLSNYEYLFVAYPSTLTCSATNIPAFSSGVRSRSLAFMRTDEDAQDQLFFSSYLEDGFERQGALTSLVQNQLTVVGEIPGFVGNGAVMELAGSATGRIFGQSFAMGETSHFVELNPYTGEVLQDTDLGIETGNAFTFSILEEYAWMFLSTGNYGYSEVFRYHPDSNDLEYIKTLSTTMLGSAAPTCSENSSGS